MKLAEKAAYIKGLAEGLDLEADKKETRIIKEMLDLLSVITGEIEDISDDLSDLYEAVDEIDEDLTFVEDELFGEDSGDDEEDEYEISCPNCKETVVVDEEALLNGDVSCPSCGEKIEIELDSCDCGEHQDEEV